MYKVVRQLLALQQVDLRVARVQRKLDDIPKETARRRKQLEELDRRREQVARAIREGEARVEDLEGKVKSLDVAIKRQQQHRDQAGNASTFTAAQHQIEYLSQDKESMQNSQITLMEQLEQQAPVLADLETQVAAAKAEFAAYEEQSRTFTEELRAEREKVAADRAAHLDGIPPQHLATYRDLFVRTDGTAVVPAEGGHCTGCYTRLTPNDRALLGAGSAMVLCKSCGRILYMET